MNANLKTVRLDREYIATVSTHHTNELRRVIGRFRVRHAAVDMFRRWYGAEPADSWGVDGFMAEAFDRARGRSVLLEQLNAFTPNRRHGEMTAPSRIKGLLAAGGGR